MRSRADIRAHGHRNLELRFTYDHLGRRTTKHVLETIDGRRHLVSALTFVYDGWNLIAELDLTGRALRTHLWGLDLSGSHQGAGGVGGLLATATPERAVFLSYDANGNLTGELDATTGLTTYTATFEVFGNVLTSEQESLTPFGFSTKYTDRETGLLYYGFRYYDPERGRWLNRDPIAERGGLNLYGFVGNDGVNDVDKLGKNPLLWKWVSDAGTAITYASLVSFPERKMVHLNQWYGYTLTPKEFSSYLEGFTVTETFLNGLPLKKTTSSTTEFFDVDDPGRDAWTNARISLKFEVTEDHGFFSQTVLLSPTTSIVIPREQLPWKVNFAIDLAYRLKTYSNSTVKYLEVADEAGLKRTGSDAVGCPELGLGDYWVTYSLYWDAAECDNPDYRIYGGSSLGGTSKITRSGWHSKTYKVDRRKILAYLE